MPPDSPNAAFADRLLSWWDVHGRRDLPWQGRDGYRVWVSEIMLQQTRVETVLPYFQRFMERFPALEDLARADQDDVLALWSGLGYYARARNLHRAAAEVLARLDGRLPKTEQELSELPGIGRSTAAAIVAQAFDRRAVILDGNVKRVLARHAGISGWPGSPAVERELWQRAERLTPDQRPADYTQAIMDLGATLCTPRSPDCERCPVAQDCMARIKGIQDELPTPRPSRKLPERHGRFVIARDGEGRVLLVRRPPVGIWGGLWCFPDLETHALELQESYPAPRPLRHVFSHFALHMRFEHGRLDRLPEEVADDEALRWFELAEALAAGLPRPVRAVLTRI